MKRHFAHWFAAVTVALAMVFAVPTMANADTGGGTGGGGSTRRVTRSGFQWNSIGYNEPGRAWSEFLSRSGLSRNFAIKQVRQRVGGTEVCEKSNVIWYVYSTTAKEWIFNFSGRTHNWPYKGTIENPQWQFGNRGPSVGEIQAFYSWDRNENGHKIDSKPGYTVICSGAFSQPDRTWTETSSKTNTSTETVNYTHPYSWSTEIKRQISVGGKDPIGADNLHNQGGTPIKSNYGRLWDNLNTAQNQGMSPAELTAAVNDALAKDAKIDRSDITLDEQNKAGMAEGGVLNVYEQTQYATVSSTETTTTVTTTTCRYTQKWDAAAGAYAAPTRECSDSDQVSKVSTASKVTGTLQNTGFWQMISVHCNQADFNALVAAGNGIKVLDSGDSTKAISAVAYSKKYDRQPSVLDFGDAKNPNAAMAATASLGFYDKECPFECTPSATGNGASKTNGAVDNIENKPVGENKITNDSKYGAKSTDSNSNFFELFRDNQDKTISADVWYPKSEGVVSYDGSAPLTTTITRWNEGTPGISDSNGGKFTMTTKDGNQLFTGNQKPENQRNWNTGTFSNATSTVLSGLHREFNVKSTWASEENKPQVLNLKWEYAPNVSTNVFTSKVGFGANGAQKTGEAVTLTTSIQGKCYANYGTESQTPTVDAFHTNTGTGTTNNLDGVLFQGAGNGANARDIQSNLVINFIRSTTE